MRPARQFVAATFLCCLSIPSAAQTLTETLASAYSVNPSLNVARSQLRAADENIAIARSANRPSLNSSFSTNTSSTLTRFRTGQEATGGNTPTSISLTFTQPLFNGFQNRNNIRQAESAIRAQRSDLVNTEQGILLDAATAFEDVIANRSIVRLRRDDVRFLAEQVRAAEDRFEVGEGTRTDVSQAEASQADAQTALNFAISNLTASEATFFQVTGLRPNRLVNNIRLDPRLPNTLEEAIAIGQREHPAIIASLYDVDTAIFNVKAAEGEFLPSVGVSGSLRQSFNSGGGVERSSSAEFGLNVSIPIYQQGRVSAQVRQAKEQLGTSRIQVDVVRDIVRQNTVASFARYRAAVRSINDARTGVFAAQLALQGVIEEQRVGQRTTLDVLDSQSTLIDAQITLIQAEREANVAGYALLSAIGRLTARSLTLPVNFYDPSEHTDVVRDKWFGFRTPDGR